MSSLIGIFLRKFSKPGTVGYLQAMLICGMAWLVLSLFGCIPFYLGVRISFLDAFFETVSGFTTTGMTIFTNIESLPRSIIFWRSLIQWFGGLGILTFFLAITFSSSSAYFQLFSAESHKVDSARPTPSIFKTVVILWSLYTFLTLCELVVLKLLGVDLFDALCHSLTTLSTGGFCAHDASIDHFSREGFVNYRAIEYVISFFMLLGGINFLVHYKVLRGRLKDAANDTELRGFVLIILCSTAFILLDHHRHFTDFSLNELEEYFRHTFFTVVSLITTTGYVTTDISDPFFPAMSKQIFLILMLIGGCVGSTAGGIKVLRITVLFKAFKRQIRRLMLPSRALSEVVINHKILPDSELKRIAGLFFGWLFLILIGGLVTAFFTDLGSFEAFSGMFSAVGNIGPSYITVQQISELPAIVKLTYIFGMLTGRLEILPVLLMFSTRAWK
jgi:trk system potassium uptake protein TrkH